MPNPGHLALVAGLASSSYFTFGNISIGYFGVMPITERGKTTLPVAARLKLWNDFYSIAKFHMAASAIASALSLSVAAYTLPSPPLRNLLALGAAASYFIPAFTVVFMLPLNNDLIAKLQADAAKPMEPREEQRVLEQLDQWSAMHRVRIACGLVALGAAFTALLATDKIISFAAN